MLDEKNEKDLLMENSKEWLVGEILRMRNAYTKEMNYWIEFRASMLANAIQTVVLLKGD